MKKTLLAFALIFIGSLTISAQRDIQKIAANFEYSWNDYLLPICPFLIYHGTDASYFLDSLQRRVPNHSYLDIKTGGSAHFIVQNEEGFHLLDTRLKRVTQKAYDTIELIWKNELRLTDGEVISYYSWDYEQKAFTFTDTQTPTPPGETYSKRTNTAKLGEVKDSRFKSKIIERLRLGIDMSQTLTVEQKGKNVLVKKGETIAFKGPTKPMLFFDFAITGEKSPHSIYHPNAGPKNPILDNCDRFWCIGSFLVASIKGSPQKHIISPTGEIILTSAGEIQYYEYEFGGRKYAFFCDGRSVVNLNGDVIYKSDGDLIGVGEHYIYSGYSGAYLRDLTHSVNMECSNFERFHHITVGQTGRGEYRIYDAKSILINQAHDYYIDHQDSVVVCVNDSKTIVCDPFEGKVLNVYSKQVEGRLTHDDSWKYFVHTTDREDHVLEGRFDPKEGIVVEPKYLKIEWPESKRYHVVLTKDGLIRYLDASGKELFD